MDKECELLKKLLMTATSVGMVAVPSGFVTQDDMDRADAAAKEIKPSNPVHFLKRECCVLSTGVQVQDPRGMQSSRLEVHWKIASIDTAVLCEIFDKCSEIS